MTILVCYWLYTFLGSVFWCNNFIRPPVTAFKKANFCGQSHFTRPSRHARVDTTLPIILSRLTGGSSAGVSDRGLVSVTDLPLPRQQCHAMHIQLLEDSNNYFINSVTPGISKCWRIRTTTLCDFTALFLSPHTPLPSCYDFTKKLTREGVPSVPSSAWNQPITCEPA